MVCQVLQVLREWLHDFRYYVLTLHYGVQCTGHFTLAQRSALCEAFVSDRSSVPARSFLKGKQKSLQERLFIAGFS